MPEYLQKRHEAASITDKDFAKKEEKFRNLKTTYGDMIFLEIVNLRQCLETFAVIFSKADTKDYINQLFFKFTCKKLNEKFKKLN